MKFYKLDVVEHGDGIIEGENPNAQTEAHGAFNAEKLTGILQQRTIGIIGTKFFIAPEIVRFL